VALVVIGLVVSSLFCSKTKERGGLLIVKIKALLQQVTMKNILA